MDEARVREPALPQLRSRARRKPMRWYLPSGLVRRATPGMRKQMGTCGAERGSPGVRWHGRAAPQNVTTQARRGAR